ncbi:hypothetical protein CCACVL1_07056 [Corchorus capsularis]|uniref:CCHC-type domain-containing protein n=1 Tax=Corchorus capsularis TaxID=210143 RepID=A0A1R3JA02_COCAP|nr:hypothetical protein CCACVL1_07056 [Corchorus capsularis]
MFGMKKGFLQGSASQNNLGGNVKLLKQEKKLKQPMIHDCVETPLTDNEEEEDGEFEEEEDDEFEGDAWISLMKDMDHFQELCLEETAKVQREENSGVKLYPSNICPYGPVPSFSTVLQRVVSKFYPEIAKQNNGVILDSKIKHLEDQIAKFKERNLELMNSIETIREENHQLKVEIAMMKQMEFDLEALTKRNAELEKQVTDLHGVKKQMQGYKIASNSDMGHAEWKKTIDNKIAAEDGKPSQCIRITNMEKFISSDMFAMFLPYDDEEKLVWLNFKRERKLYVCAKCGRPGHPRSKCRFFTVGGITYDSLAYNLFVQNNTQSHGSRMKQSTPMQFECQAKRVQSEFKDQSSLKSTMLMTTESMEQVSLAKGIYMPTCDNSSESTSTVCSSTNQEVTSSTSSNSHQTNNQEGIKNMIPKDLGEASEASNLTFTTGCKKKMVSNPLAKYTQRKHGEHLIKRKRWEAPQSWKRKEDIKHVEMTHMKRAHLLGKEKLKATIRRRRPMPKRLNIQLGKRSASCDLGSTFVLRNPEKKRIKLEGC